MEKRKRLAIIGTAGVPACYGGFETLAHHLVLNLKDDFDLIVYCSNHYYTGEERVKEWNGARLVHLPINANGIQSIPYDIVSILHALIFADILLILGVSGCILIPFIKLFTRKKLIVNIDGLEWKRNKWIKPIKMFLKLSEYFAVKFSDADVTDNEVIQKYTARTYNTLSHYIPYGADHVCQVDLDTVHGREALFEKYPFLAGKYAFTVCRIEPENNIHVILEAFESISHLPLVIVGNWNKSEYGTGLRNKYAAYTHIHLLDPIYEQEKLDVLRCNAHIYIHGHSAGGTNPSLVEAMYLGLPIFAFTAPQAEYNQATTDNEAFYFTTAEDLVKGIRKADDRQLESCRFQMFEIARNKYRWEVVAHKYKYLAGLFDYDYSKRSVVSQVGKHDYDFLAKRGLAHLKNPKLFD